MCEPGFTDSSEYLFSCPCFVCSPSREQALEILCSAVLQNSNPVDVMFTFVNSPDQVLLPSVMFVPTKGHVVRRSDMSASSPWSDELREVWPPGMSLLNPSIVNIMDLLVERAKDKPAAGSKNGSTSEPDLPTPASDVAWNRKSTGANVVRMMLTRCLVDLTRSLRGRPANEPTTTNSTFLEAGVDVDPKVTQQLEGDFVRLNLIATTSERYGPDILPKTDEVMNFIAHGLAAAAFVLDPSKANAKVLEEASSGPGKGMLLGQFGCWTINIFAAQVWSLVSVQLCLALLSNQLEIDTSVSFFLCQYAYVSLVAGLSESEFLWSFFPSFYLFSFFFFTSCLYCHVSRVCYSFSFRLRSKL